MAHHHAADPGLARRQRHECRHVRCQETSNATEARAKISRRRLPWGLEVLVLAHLSLRGSWPGSASRGTPPTTRSRPKADGVLLNDPGRFDGARVLGVEEHVCPACLKERGPEMLYALRRIAFTAPRRHHDSEGQRRLKVVEAVGSSVEIFP